MLKGYFRLREIGGARVKARGEQEFKGEMGCGKERSDEKICFEKFVFAA